MHKLYSALIALCACILLFVSGPALAQESVCYLSALRKSTSDADLAACTRELQSGRYQGANLAITYNNRGRIYLDRKELDKAYDDFDQAIRINPQDGDGWINRGYVHWERRNLEAALNDLNRGLQIKPNSPSGYITRGNVQHAKGDLDRAIADYNEAIRRDSRDAIAVHNRGLMYLHKRDLERAIADFSEAIVLKADYADAFNNRGVAFHRKGDQDRSLADYSEAIRLNPKHILAHDNRGSIYEARGDYDRAIADYSTAIELEPDNAGFWNSRCWTRAIGNRDLPRALSDCDRSLQIRRRANTLDSRGLVYLRLGRIEEAIGDYDEAIREDPKNAYSFFGRALAKLKKGDKAGADRDFDTAKDLNPKIAETFQKFGLQP